jgi:hypothetical protein
VAKDHPNVTPVILDVADDASVRAAFQTVRVNNRFYMKRARRTPGRELRPRLPV